MKTKERNERKTSMSPDNPWGDSVSVGFCFVLAVSLPVDVLW